MPDIWIPKDWRTLEDGDDYSDAEHVAKPHGIIFVNGKEVASTLQCCHCGMHWVPKKGSGIRRGFCLRHMQVTCGAEKCVECQAGLQDV